MKLSPPLDEISAAHFKDCEGQDFHLKLGDRSMALTLTQISSLRGDSSRSDRSPFSLTFRGSADIYLDQQTVALRHEALGELHLFLVPLGPDPDDEKKRIQYEAIFT